MKKFEFMDGDEIPLEEDLKAYAPGYKPALDIAQALGASRIVPIPNMPEGPTGLYFAMRYMAEQDAATREAVDTIAQETFRSVGPREINLMSMPTVRIATTAPVVRAGLDPIDGVQIQQGDRILVKDQQNANENGFYIARPEPWLLPNEMIGPILGGSLVYVIDGNINGGTQWILMDTAQRPGFSTMHWVEYSRSGR